MSIELNHVLLIGAGGHAKVVYDTLRRIDPTLSIQVMDEDNALDGHDFVDTYIEALSLPHMIVTKPAHIAIGDNATRQRLGRELAERGHTLFSVIHPAAVVSPRAQISEGALIAAMAIVGPGATVGKGGIVNHGAVVDHDCVIGPWAHIAPNATLGGGVTVGEGALVGAGAVVLPATSIEAWATVGAGAVVTSNVAAHAVVMGVPAKERSR